MHLYFLPFLDIEMIEIEIEKVQVIENCPHGRQWRAWVSYLINFLAVGDLVMQVSKASAAVALATEYCDLGIKMVNDAYSQ